MRHPRAGGCDHRRPGRGSSRGHGTKPSGAGAGVGERRHPKDVPRRGKTLHTGVWKYQAAGPRMVRRLNIEGGRPGRPGWARRGAARGARLPDRFLPRRSSAGLIEAISRSPNQIRPEVGSVSRLIIRSVVVFPDPGGPTSTVISPEAASSLSPLAATVPSAYRLVTESKRIITVPIQQLARRTTPSSCVSGHVPVPARRVGREAGLRRGFPLGAAEPWVDWELVVLGVGCG